MKELFLFAFVLITQITLAQPLLPLPNVILPSSCGAACTDPNPIGDPYIWNGDCSIGIERYLARTIAMPNLANYNNDNLNGQTSCDPNNNYASDTWFHDYCPEKYCELIDALPLLDAQLIQAAYIAGHEQELYPGARWYAVGRQLVVDINHAYDCAGKRRPIIQGFVGEIFDANNVDSNLVNQWNPIPPELITKYFYYYPEDLTHDEWDYYFSGEDVYFTKERMANYEIDFNGNPNWILDISKIEMRMWFLYQAITLIDFGYTSIHMGLYSIYADHYTDPNYEKLYRLTNVFRQYADEVGSFVLLSGESPMGNIDNGLSAKLGGTDQLIFDFDTRALRPREISNPQVSGDGGVLVNGQLEAACTEPIPADILSAFNQSPCADEPYPAIVNPCTINNFGGSSGGIAPALDGSGNSNCNYEQVPYIASLDGFNAPIEHVATNGPSKNVWGYDDHTWFSQLQPDCREWWFNYFYCNRRDYMGGHGFLSIPGINIISNGLTPEGKRFITDDPAFFNSVISGLQPDLMPVLEIKEKCIYTDTECRTECNGEQAEPGNKFRVGEKIYSFNIVHKDCSSVYSIHVKDPNGNWLPFKEGDSYELHPQIEGIYEIIARQDNLAIPGQSFGTNEIIKSEYLFKNCCMGEVCIDDDQCGYWSIGHTKEPGKIRYNVFKTPAFPSGTTFTFRVDGNILQTGFSKNFVVNTNNYPNGEHDMCVTVTQPGCDPVQKCHTFIVYNFGSGQSSTEEKSSEIVLKISNPSSGSIGLSKVLENGEAILYSVQGALIKAFSLNHTNLLDVSEIVSGQYFLKIKTKDMSVTKKAIIQN